MRCQKLFVDPGRVMKSIEMRRRHQLHKVAIASLVFRQEREVICRIAPRGRPIFMRAGRDVGFATNDRFYSRPGRFLVKFNRAKQIAVIGDRDGRHLEFGRFFHQLFHSDRTVEQRIFGVQMQMNERIAGH